MPISVLAHVAAASVAGGNVTSAAIDTSNAFLLVAYVAWDQNSVNAQFQDSKGNIWQHVTPQSEFQIGTLFYCIGPTVGAGHTFTASATNSSYPSLDRKST